ncbi:hypothetical protein [Clostridium cylindrosporum]|uniref:Glycosyl hydrolase-like 10 domain-containing protein n=1 Tax=Clostridium cylindrosporum DSM 605 TaxID=1121307 RepID=A0A0J8G395_CLOCY|nr:hypothetical protein [Clostridium cylindrosporum]KMT22181.1 hypothetical protein CLCY_4c01540 [Clostridium cylindrosporum DSM 605]
MKGKRKGLIFSLLILLICIVIGGGYWYLESGNISSIKKSLSKENEIYEGNTKKRPLNTGVFILTKNLKSYKGTYSAFTSVGYDVLSGDFSKYESNLDYKGTFIFPQDEVNSLSYAEIDKIKMNIEKGQNAIITGKSKLSEALGIDIKYDKKVSKYTMKGHEKQKIEVKDGMASYQFKAPSGFEKLAINSIDGTDLMVVGNMGKGRVIYSGSELAPSEGSGYEYYPFLLDVFSKEFKLAPVYSRNNGAIYIDIGYHLGVETPAQVANKAKEWGYDQINVGVWASMTDDNIAYYKGLIEESHKRGIKVFAWFELPMVSVDFWNAHPEWRQKTADGKDAHLDWRYLMALENRDCFNAVKEYVKGIMNRFDFDGIDIAEIYYESPGKGFMDSSLFTPMNDAFRNDFKKKYGYDPKESFKVTSKNYWMSNKKAKENLIKERISLITNQHREMLELSEEMKKDRPYLETNVTMIDSIADNRMRENIGLDAKEIVNLQKKYKFILEIEDPFTLWSLGPERYSVIGENYRKLMNKGDKLFIDINIIDRYGQNYPTKKQRGTEVYSLIHNASKYTDKVIMYALATLEEEDMTLAPYAYAYDVVGKETALNTYEFDAKQNFIWHVDMKNKEVYMDGKKYPVYTDNTVIVPYGKHKVEIKDASYKGIRITDINSDIKYATVELNGIKIDYNAAGRCFINVDKKPTSIEVNRKIITPNIKEINGTYTIMLPKGENTVIIK